MNKQELIDAVAAVTGDSKTATADMVNAVLGFITCLPESREEFQYDCIASSET
jgi:DNA-binding protein HU-beta